MELLYPVFRDAVVAGKIIQPHDTVVCAFSGGRDSSVLLVLLQRLREDIPFNLEAAYFNHHLRTDSDLEQTWVKKWCADRQISLTIGGAMVREYQQQHQLNLENAASLLRYRFLADQASRYPAAKIATAHTRSDLVETFMIKLLRGSGIQGLSSIYQKKFPAVIRPLLGFEDSDLAGFIERMNIRFYRDPSNQDRRFLRNRIRHELVPILKIMEPEVMSRIARTVMLLQDEHDFFLKEAGKWLARESPHPQILTVEQIRNLHPALQRHIIRYFIRIIKGDLKDIDYHHVEEVRRLLSHPGSASVPGATLHQKKGFLYPNSPEIPRYRLQINGAGSYTIDPLQITVKLSRLKRFREPRRRRQIVFPASLCSPPFFVRSPERTDRYRKINASFTQTVFEMIRESGYPAALRNLCPVLTDSEEEVLWVAGCPPARKCLVRDKSEGPFWQLTLVPFQGNQLR